jgi:hypothetical protein
MVVSNSRTSRTGSNPGPRQAVPRVDDLVDHLSKSPHPSVEELERLLSQRHQRGNAHARKQFEIAFSRLQVALPLLSENGEIRDRDGRLAHTYALWEDINEVVKPILTEYGFSLWFRTSVEANRIAVTAVLSHVGGHREETTLSFPSDLTGNKNAVQAIGSSTSYGKRYTASALLNLVSRGEDDDGAAASQPSRISADQAEFIRSSARRTGADEARLTAYLQIPCLEDLPADRFQRALDAIAARGATE